MITFFDALLIMVSSGDSLDGDGEALRAVRRLARDNWSPVGPLKPCLYLEGIAPQELPNEFLSGYRLVGQTYGSKKITLRRV